MPFSFRRLSKIHLLALGLVILVAVVGLAVSKRSGTPAAVASAASPVAMQATASRAPVKVLSVTVTSSGFSPSELEVPEGLYLLDINNRSGLSELTLQFGHLDSRKLKEAKPAKDKQGRALKMQDWRGLFNLDKGNYTITEVAHPKWSLQIKVKDKAK